MKIGSFFILNITSSTELKIDIYYIIAEEKNQMQEEICRRTLEKISGKIFSPIRPQWLKNPKTGRAMELDCFNPQLRIALEFNGPQHYNYPNPFHKRKEEFDNQRDRDKAKRKICKDKKVDLIIVPFNLNNLEKEVRETAWKLLNSKLTWLDSLIAPYPNKERQIVISIDFSSEKRWWTSIHREEDYINAWLPLINIEVILDELPRTYIKWLSKILEKMNQEDPIVSILARKLKGSNTTSSTSSFFVADKNKIKLSNQLIHWLAVAIYKL